MEEVAKKEICFTDKETGLMVCYRGTETELFEILARSRPHEILARFAREAIKEEISAINSYEMIADLADELDYPEVARVFRSVAKEEKVHVGEFTYVLDTLSSEDYKSREKGEEEASLEME